MTAIHHTIPLNRQLPLSNEHHIQKPTTNLSKTSSLSIHINTPTSVPPSFSFYYTTTSRHTKTTTTTLAPIKTQAPRPSSNDYRTIIKFSRHYFIFFYQSSQQSQKKKKIYIFFHILTSILTYSISKKRQSNLHQDSKIFKQQEKTAYIRKPLRLFALWPLLPVISKFGFVGSSILGVNNAILFLVTISARQ